MPLSSLSTSTPRTPRAQARRVKRGIVAGYIHDISGRHSAEPTHAASTPVTPAPAPALPAPVR